MKRVLMIALCTVLLECSDTQAPTAGSGAPTKAPAEVPSYQTGGDVLQVRVIIEAIETNFSSDNNSPSDWFTSIAIGSTDGLETCCTKVTSTVLEQNSLDQSSVPEDWHFERGFPAGTAAIPVTIGLWDNDFAFSGADIRDLDPSIFFDFLRLIVRPNVQPSNEPCRVVGVVIGLDVCNESIRATLGVTTVQFRVEVHNVIRRGHLPPPQP